MNWRPCEHQLVTTNLECDRRVLTDFASDQSPSELGLNLPLKESLEGPRAKDRVVTLLARPLLRLFVEFHRDAPVRQPLIQIYEQEVHDRRDFVQRERFEQNGLVDAV